MLIQATAVVDSIQKAKEAFDITNITDAPGQDGVSIFSALFEEVVKFKPAIVVLILFGLIYFGTRYLLRKRRSKTNQEWSIIETIVMFTIASIGIITFIISLPFPQDIRSGVVQLLGIAISGALAFSSASFLANGLSGILLKVINNFKSGDFIHVDNHFGRVSERGLFHTEIQNETRDLTTLPNKLLTESPVKVIRTSGTFISTEVSLGYDVHRLDIEKVLLEAAKEAGLKEAFVHVVSLGDFSIVYRVHGLLENVKTIITARSRLNGRVLDALHHANIEIVSPTFMNQRQVNETVFIPKPKRGKQEETEVQAEAVMFDKADKAEDLEKKKETLSEVEEKIAAIQAELKAVKNDDAAKAEVEKRLERYTTIREKMLNRIEDKVEEIKEK